MIIKKIQTSLVALAILSVVGINAQNLNVLDKGGNKTPIAINTIRSLTFPSGNLNINLKVGTPLTLSLSSVQNINFFIITDVTSPIDQSTGKINIYPNPAKEFTTLRFHTPEFTEYDLKIISIDGRTVHSKKLNNSDINEYTIDISSWQNGLYGVFLYDGKSVYSGKFVKTN